MRAIRQWYASTVAWIPKAASSTFARNVRTLIGGNVLAQGVTLLLTPIVARLFTPEDFGKAALFISLAAVATSIISLRYNQAVVLPKDEDSAIKLLMLSLSIAVILAGLLFVFCVIIGQVAPDFVWVRDLGVWFYAIPFAVALMGGSYAMMEWWLRHKQFRRLAYGPIAQNLINSGSRIGFGYFGGSSVAGLIAGSLLGMVAQLMVFGHGLWRSIHSHHHEKTSFGALRKLAAEYREFALYGTPGALVKQLGENLPVLMLSLLFAPNVVGFFAIASRLVRLPVELVCESLRRVYLQRVADFVKTGIGLRSDLIKMSVVMAVLGLVPSAALMLAGEELFALVLGDRWADAGHYAAILAPWLFTVFVVTPASTVYIVLRKQALWLRLQTTRAVVAVVALYVPAALGRSVDDSLVLFVAVGVVMNASIVMNSLRLTSPK